MSRFVVIRDYGIDVREIVTETPKFYKLAGRRAYPRQIEKGSRKIVCIVEGERAAVEVLAQSIGGAEGEYKRRDVAARADYNARLEAAAEARDKAIARLVEQFSLSTQPFVVIKEGSGDE